MRDRIPELPPAGSGPSPPVAVPASDEEWLRVRVRRHLSELLRLAGPVVLSRGGILLISTVDLAMLARIGMESTAFYAQASIPFVILLVTGIGLMFGTSVASAHAFGRGDFRECGAIWRRSLVLALLVGVALTVPGIWALEFFLAVGIDPVLAAGAGQTALILSLGIIPMMFYSTCAFFLESLKRPVSVMVAIYLANAVNFALNFLLIDGGSGFTPTTSEGAALAATVSRFAMGGGLVAYIWFMPDREKFGVRDAPKGGWWQGSREQRRYGYASGISFGLETAAFGVINIFAGWLGVQAAAAYGLGMNVTALIFMLALGLSSATAVRVGIAHGRRDWPDRTLAGWVGLGVTVVFISLFTLVLNSAPEAVAGLYTGDPELMALTASVFFVVAWLVIADGAQICLSNTLRAAADPWSPIYLNFAAFFVAMIPASYLFAFTWERGLVGLFEGTFVGAAASAVLLGLRWIWLCRRG